LGGHSGPPSSFARFFQICAFQTGYVLSTVFFHGTGLWTAAGCSCSSDQRGTHGPTAAAMAGAPDHRLAFTKLTCVHYARGDLIGKALAHASLLPVLLLCAQAAKVYARRCGR
jgi:hypothetical protein